MRLNLLASALLCALLLLTACGGGGSGGGEETTDSVNDLAGVVYDGPVVGAWVFLVDAEGDLAEGCGASGIGKCVASRKTDADGYFTIPVSSRPLSPNLTAVTSGGRDAAIDFRGIPLRAPLDLFAAGRPIVISPVTSLVFAEMRENGGNLEGARRAVAEYLELPQEILSEDPAAYPQLKRACELITTFAFLDGGFDPLKELDDSESTELRDLLQSAPEGFDVLHFALTQAMKKVIDRFFAESGGDFFEPADPNYLANLQILAAAALQSGGEAVAPLDRLFPQRLARYLLFVYGLTSFERFTADQATFAAGLHHPQTADKLETDPFIAELARVTTLQSAGTPLLDSELPGDDNQKRLHYFYNSDLSPFYLVESLVSEIPDATFSDPVMLTVARGKAQAGLLAEAEAIVATQIIPPPQELAPEIFQARLQGEGYYEIAKALIGFGRPAEAVAALGKAEKSYKIAIEYGAPQPDISRLQWLGNAYRRAGDIPASLAVLQYILDHLMTPNTYGSVIVGTWKIADEYMAAERYEEALPLVDFMYDLASKVVDEKQKVFYLAETARRYASLGHRETVEAIYLEMQAIRAANPDTASVTWLYMSYMVDILYRVGAAAEAYWLAEQLPSAYMVSSYKLVVTNQAVDGSLAQAIANSEARFAKAEDRIEAMTYYLTNESRPYIALSLIEAGRLAETRQALDQALLYMPGLTLASDLDRYQKLVQRGYVKLAGLYARAGDPARAESLLAGEAEGVLLQIIEPKYRVEAMADIAYGYHLLGQTDRGAALLQRAADEIAAALAGTSRPADSATAATLYNGFASMYQRLIGTAFMTGHRPLARSLTLPFVSTAEAIFNDGLAYTGDDHDKWASKEVDLLLQAADFLIQAGAPQEAPAILARAEVSAGQIWVEKTRIEKLISDGKRCVIRGYAAAGQFATALDRARALPYAADRYLALQTLANAFANRDDFPWTEVASIDSDHDGWPDFFHPFATSEAIAASGLSLDPDSDGDGIPDTADRRPWYVDSSTW